MSHTAPALRGLFSFGGALLTVICNEKQLPTQLERHAANALLNALRAGARFERPGTPWRSSARTPNAPVNLPYSPVMDDLRTNARKVARLERRAELSPEERGKLSLLLGEREALVQLARDAIWKEPQWPYVAGLYAIRVPEVRLIVDGAPRVEPPRCHFRAVDVDDRDAIWPVMRAVLSRVPRGTPPGAAFYPDRSLYKRSAALPPTLAAWLVEKVHELRLDELQPGDYAGKREEKESA